MSAQARNKPFVEKLRADHALAAFDCGVSALNRFLQSHALINRRADSAQTYVAIADATVAGYYSLTVGSVAHADAPERVAKGLPRYPVPAMILARLAVDRRFQARGLGAGLLLDSLRRTQAAADIAGIRAFIVHAKDEPARAFYQYFGFTAFTDQPLSLYRLLKDIRLQNPGAPS